MPCSFKVDSFSNGKVSFQRCFFGSDEYFGFMFGITSVSCLFYEYLVWVHRAVVQPRFPEHPTTAHAVKCQCDIWQIRRFDEAVGDCVFCCYTTMVIAQHAQLSGPSQMFTSQRCVHLKKRSRAPPRHKTFTREGFERLQPKSKKILRKIILAECDADVAV